jgi:hypothetical protein
MLHPRVLKTELIRYRFFFVGHYDMERFIAECVHVDIPSNFDGEHGKK